MGINSLRCDVDCDSCGRSNTYDNLRSDKPLDDQEDKVIGEFEESGWGYNDDGEFLCEACYDEYMTSADYIHANNHENDDGSYGGCECDDCESARNADDDEDDAESSEAETEAVLATPLSLMTKALIGIRELGANGFIIKEFERASGVVSPVLVTSAHIVDIHEKTGVDFSKGVERLSSERIEALGLSSSFTNYLAYAYY